MIYSNLRRFIPLFLMVVFIFVGLIFVHHANAGGGSPYIGTYSASSNGLQVASDNSYLTIQLANLGGRNPGLWGDSGGTAPVASSSLDIYDAEGAATTTIQIISVTATSGAALVGGESEIKVLISVSEGVDYNSLFTIGPAATYEIYCANGGTKITTTKGAVFLHNPLAPQIVSAVAAPDNSYITVTFDKPVWGDAASSTSVVVGSVVGIASVSPDESITSMSLPSITTSAGETTIEINLTYTGIPDSDDLVWIGFTTNSVYAADGTTYMGYLVTGWVPLNDSVTIIESDGSTDVTEGGATDSYTVVLDSEPTNDVEITIATDTQIDASPMTLTFTDANWDTPQEVTVTTVDDSVVEGNHTGTISHIASSTDTGYDGISISDVTANITDNEFGFDPTDPTTVFTVDGGDPESTTLLTATTNVIATTTNAVGDIEIIIPTGTQIIDSNGDPFDATAIDTSDAAGSITASTIGSGVTIQGAVDFGIPDTTFYFSVPVTIRIPVDVNDGTTLSIKRSSDGGVTWNSTGFTESSLDGCTDGIGDNPVTTTVVAGGYITIYTCRASVFATYSTSLPSGGRRDPVVVNWSYGPGYEPGAATSTPTSTTTPVSVAELQQQINSLIAQLQALILQAKAKGLNIPAAAQALVGTTPSFTRDLEYGMNGEDVRQLQIYLNTHGYPVSTTGDGSLGHETTYFGSATRAALIKFQQASEISPAAGYFGPKTRTYIALHP